MTEGNVIALPSGLKIYSWRAWAEKYLVEFYSDECGEGHCPGLLPCEACIVEGEAALEHPSCDEAMCACAFDAYKEYLSLVERVKWSWAKR